MIVLSKDTFEWEHMYSLNYNKGYITIRVFVGIESPIMNGEYTMVKVVD